MKIAVIGAGGVGGYFGARLAKAGHEVQFLARGAHLEAMRARGLRVTSEVESFIVESPSATDDPARLNRAHVMLVATKLWDLASTGRQLAPAVGTRTVVIPIQNGVDAVELLAQSISPERIAVGVALISAVIAEPGVVAHTGTMARLRVGAMHPDQQETLRDFVAAGATAGFGSELVDDPGRMLWEKFIALNALSGLTALTRQTLGVIRSDPDMRVVLEATLREGIALAEKSGVAISADYEASSLNILDSLPPSMRASMAHDLLAGRRLEAPWICGAVVRRAALVGLPVPVNSAIWAALKPFAEGHPSHLAR